MIKNEVLRHTPPLSFLEKLAHTGTMWYGKTKEQKNTKIRHINKFYKVINIVSWQMQQLWPEDFVLGLMTTNNMMTIPQGCLGDSLAVWYPWIDEGK